ncbi:DUF6602 domain-containing protein [Bradyrhizobium sp. AUGA SZCCT0160]|uniref:DUF6602 domain-containing protein n=1 Tax=Bradyrhizobium sp. AUGA SZCCT0160 TaxID=2807662 RepID=UPI001BA4F6B9|nr:DUF6602 domain-containing protein [Bradyrhizobium sp. AUGA SZCCT0160]MBR1189215.1 hypothetical protein [Bradyrhizobium sp. AUGA SZCCT0160]
MAKRATSSGAGSSPHLSYMSALQDIADQSQRELGRMMPHAGERGRIAEEIIKSVLSRTLPKRFSIGTGVVISAHGDVSRQTDIVIYDNFFNSPLLSEFGACLFPAEIVFATIEVKSVLTKRELRTSMDAIMQMRKVGSQKKYVVPVTISDVAKPSRTATVRYTEKTPPRNYIVAFAQKGLGPNYQRFCEKLRACLDEDHSHVHGVCILDEGWFAGRRAYKRPAELFGGEGNGLLQLYSHILKAQQNFAVHAMDLDAYLPKEPSQV